MLDDSAYLQQFQRRSIAERISEAACSYARENSGFLGDLLEIVRCPEAPRGQENGHASDAVIFFMQTVLPFISSHISCLDVGETLRQIGIYLEEDVRRVRNTAL